MTDYSFNLNEMDGRYYANIYDPGSGWRTNLSLMTEQESVARQRLAKWERMAVAGEWDPRSGRPTSSKRTTLEQAAEMFLADYEKDRRESTYAMMESVLRQFRRQLGDDYPIGQVTADDVRAYITSLSARGSASPPGSAAQSTKRERFGKLHTFFRWLSRKEVIDRVPTESVERPRAEPGTSYNVLSPSDADRLLRATEGRWMQAVIEVALSSGLRLGELAHLRWADVDTSGLDAGPVEIRVTPRDSSESERGEWRPKTPHSKRAVQVYPRGRSVLKSLWNGQDDETCVLREESEQVLRHGWVQARMREARRRAGFSRDITMHDLRHTWFSWLLNDLGLARKAPAVSRMGGHAEISRTWSYVEASDEAGRDAVHESIGLKAPSGREEEVRAWLTADSVVVSTEESGGQAVYNHR